MSRARSLARTRAMQALYQWQLTEQDALDIARQFVDDQDMAKVDLDYFRRLLTQVAQQAADLDTQLDSKLDRPIAQLDPVEHAILWIAGYELAHCPEVPYRVVINEAVELAKSYGAEQSHRYVNGVLDKLAKELRAVEVAARQR